MQGQKWQEAFLIELLFYSAFFTQSVERRMVKVNFKSDEYEMYSIPSTALFSEAGDDRTYVWLISADNVVVRKREVAVKTLHTNGTADISLGLQAGNVIITAGVHQLHEGQKVQGLKETSSTNVGSLL